MSFHYRLDSSVQLDQRLSVSSLGLFGADILMRITPKNPAIWTKLPSLGTVLAANMASRPILPTPHLPLSLVIVLGSPTLTGAMPLSDSQDLCTSTPGCSPAVCRKGCPITSYHATTRGKRGRSQTVLCLPVASPSLHLAKTEKHTLSHEVALRKPSLLSGL